MQTVISWENTTELEIMVGINYVSSALQILGIDQLKDIVSD